MSKNIKEIGKELMGKSLNSFHRKTGLTQLEENNKMQDGILDGILSQVDDTYIEKTEQSNVMHLEGSGDGVVVVDGIEGNTMVNLIDYSKIPQIDPMYQTWTKKDNGLSIDFKNSRDVIWIDGIELKANTRYTIMYNLEITITSDSSSTTEVARVGYFVCNKSEKLNWYSTYYNSSYINITNDDIGKKFTNKVKVTFTTKEESCLVLAGTSFKNGLTGNTKFKNLILLEGDYTDKEISFFEGLQSSFEEKVNDEGKYEIEILSKTSKNLYDLKTVNHDWTGGTMDVIISPNDLSYHSCEPFDISHLRGKTIYTGMFRDGVLRNNGIQFVIIFDKNRNKIGERFNITSQGYLVPNNAKYMRLMQYCGGNSKSWIDRDKYVVKLEPFTSGEKLVKHKSNKIKLLINEPLRATKHGKDVMCVKNGKLMVERNCGETILNGSENWNGFVTPSDGTVSYSSLRITNLKVNNGIDYLVCDKFPTVIGNQYNYNREMIYTWSNGAIYIHITTSKVSSQNVQGFKTWLQNNPVKLVYQLENPTYEEVLNEYGEPILLEGYENGTIYIDSTIVPTTTLRYTPKMESMRVAKEVNNNNTMLVNDVNEMIIPYMMEVDMLILEKEMALPSQINIRRIGEKDMTSMQKRTGEMLTRLIKGKSLTKEDAKTRVTVYLDAGKITDAQAEELMLLIEEIYI